MPDEERPRDDSRYLAGRVATLVEQMNMLRESMGENLRGIRQEGQLQEARLKDAIREGEQRAQARSQEITHSIEQQNANIRDALREDRQQWIVANKEMRDQLVSLVKAVEDKHTLATRSMEEKYTLLIKELSERQLQDRADIKPLQKYMFMAMGALGVLGAVWGFLQFLWKIWGEKMPK